jgi:hypothetical protein
MKYNFNLKTIFRWLFYHNKSYSNDEQFDYVHFIK